MIEYYLKNIHQAITIPYSYLFIILLTIDT